MLAHQKCKAEQICAGDSCSAKKPQQTCCGAHALAPELGQVKAVEADNDACTSVHSCKEAPRIRFRTLTGGMPFLAIHMRLAAALTEPELDTEAGRGE